eukprot:19305-Chlamydomonas_euryale.AAC.4
MPYIGLFDDLKVWSRVWEARSVGLVWRGVRSETLEAFKDMPYIGQAVVLEALGLHTARVGACLHLAGGDAGIHPSYWAKEALLCSRSPCQWCFAYAQAVTPFRARKRTWKLNQRLQILRFGTLSSET